VGGGLNSGGGTSRDAPPGNLPPVGRAGCPSGDLPPVGRAGCRRRRVSSLFVNKKISYSRRGPREGPGKYFGTSRPLDRREVSGPTPPARGSGGRHLFFENFQNGTHFSNLIFLTPFLKILLPGRGLGDVRNLLRPP
jgi:hypothetical protein